MSEEEKIEKLIRDSLKTEEPSADFKNNIMNQIEAFDAKEEKALRSLMGKHIIESPSVNFTDRVMHEIQKASIAVVNKPIIGKKTWILIALSLLSLVIYSVFISSGSTEPSVVGGFIGESMSKLPSVPTFDLPGILTSPIFGLSVFALSSLLFLDYYLRNRHVSVKL